MPLRFPLYARLLLWFFLNLLILAVAFYLAFALQFRVGLDSFLTGRVGERVRAVSEVIAGELRTAPAGSWNDVLSRFTSAYQVRFSLFRLDGTPVAGEALELPAEVLAKVTERHGPADGLGMGPPPGRGPRWAQNSGAARPEPRFLLRTTQPGRYWIGVRIPVSDPESRRPWPLMLVAVSDSMRGGGLLFDLTPWLVVGIAAVLFSIVFWFPLVRGITRSISQMTQASERMAEGRFDLQVTTTRGDELGRLGQAINRMAARLSGFVSGQKRFLGDVAHELCSPIARIQVALGILEQRAGEKEKPYVADIREEVQQMSGLINELLAFSKAGLQPRSLKLEPVNLAGLVRRVLAREGLSESQVVFQIDADLRAMAEPELLGRAVANLLRNAVRHAGGGGISITSHVRGDHVMLTVSDAGPGVPEATLEQIFDPFFRVESARSRDTGGVGLGLAIVKTCVEACQGTVSARNRKPSGLEVEIVLSRAS
ncbi:MAG TPA: HAMP domain-containing sensor histidine kinase [Bacillota bacterium]|nr:HAMP domain-containing sensor histidine kinase [Bacillota bacterium]